MNRAFLSFKMVLVTTALLFYVGCDDKENEPASEKGTISAVSRNVKELQVVELAIQGIVINDESFPAQFGDIDIELFRIDDEHLAFVVPAQTGGKSFSLTTPIATNTLSFDVTEVVLKEAPDDIVDAFVGPDPDLQFEGYLATAQQLMLAGLISTVEVDLFEMYRSRLNQAIEEYRSLPDAEKEAVAKFLAANSEGIAALNGILADLNSNALAIGNARMMGICDDVTFKVDKVKCGAVLLLDAFIVLGSGLGAAVLATNPLGIAIATGIVAYVTIPAAMSFKQNALAIINSRVKAELVEAGALSGRLKNDVVNMNQPYPIDLRVLKTNFQKNDANSNVSWVRDVLSTIEDFRVMWDNLRPKIKDAELTPFVYPDSSAVLEGSESLSFLSVEVLNRPDIEASLSEENGMVSVTFSGSGTGAFEYVFRYNDGSFQAESQPLAGVVEDDSFIEITVDGVTYRGTGSNDGGYSQGTDYHTDVGSSESCGSNDDYYIYITGVACDENNTCIRLFSTITHRSSGGCGFIPLSEKSYPLGTPQACDMCTPTLIRLDITPVGTGPTYTHADSDTWLSITEVTDDYFTGTFRFFGCNQSSVDHDNCQKPSSYYCCPTPGLVTGSFRVRL